METFSVIHFHCRVHFILAFLLLLSYFAIVRKNDESCRLSRCKLKKFLALHRRITIQIVSRLLHHRMHMLQIVVVMLHSS